MCFITLGEKFKIIYLVSLINTGLSIYSWVSLVGICTFYLPHLLQGVVNYIIYFYNIISNIFQNWGHATSHYWYWSFVSSFLSWSAPLEFYQFCSSAKSSSFLFHLFCVSFSIFGLSLFPLIFIVPFFYFLLVLLCDLVKIFKIGAKEFDLRLVFSVTVTWWYKLLWWIALAVTHNFI